ncbi:hypothetical protein, partial [Enterobacter cloacae complex sp. 742-ADZ3-9B]|uniref:hypothetical protein n=1 Tax=Enterobacter cloacae complex sp. 742-ADZ3-9B TaxID=2511992 RepID=UPI001027FBC1
MLEAWRSHLAEGRRRSPHTVLALVAGTPVRGSWWSHPAGRAIYAVTQMLERHPDALSVRLVGGKVTWAHR